MEVVIYMDVWLGVSQTQKAEDVMISLGESVEWASLFVQENSPTWINAITTYQQIRTLKLSSLDLISNLW